MAAKKIIPQIDETEQAKIIAREMVLREIAWECVTYYYKEFHNAEDGSEEKREIGTNLAYWMNDYREQMDREV